MTKSTGFFGLLDTRYHVIQAVLELQLLLSSPPKG